MFKLYTVVSIPEAGFKINYNNTACFFGSCFSNYIGNRLIDLKFNTLVNPFGVLYNPASITQSFEIIMENRRFSEKDLEYHNGLWFSFYHYTSFSNTDKSACLDAINNNLLTANEKIKDANVFIITLGTSYAYSLKESGKTVANCHKLPDSNFNRIFLGPDESVRLLSKTIQHLTDRNPSVNVIITISPIRHWKEGAVGNLRSKAALILAAHELENKFDNVFYFPVYEIFMDELRDYRFYATDMLHPSEFAIEYIWEKFVNCFFDTETKKTVQQVNKINKSLNHRPFNRSSAQHQKFLNRLKEQIEAFIKKHPHIDFSEEIAKL